MSVEQSLIAFSLAAMVLAATPGIDTALVLRMSISAGARRGLAAAFGIAAGCLLWGAVVATGLGVTVLPSSAADELAVHNPLVAVRPFSDPQPSRRVALAWRVTYPRNGAIDVLRRAILDSELPGVKVVGRA